MKRLQFLAALTVGLLWSQVSLPETPAGQRLGQWLKVFNGGQRAEILEFFEKYYPARAANVDAPVAMSKQTGGFNLEKVEESSETKISAVMKTRAAGREMRVTLETDPD